MHVKGLGILALALIVSPSAYSLSFLGKLKNAFNDCKYSSSEYNETLQYENEITPVLPEHFSGQFSESDFVNKPWMRDFRLVIVVNKAATGPTAQTLRVYESTQLIYGTKISTGREGFELRRKNKSCAGAPPKSYWSQTPTGFYTPKFLSKDHKSSSWDSDMPYAVFFDIDNGLALHQAAPSYMSMLGQRASGGCVRQDKQSAEYIFNMIAATENAIVPGVNVDGTPVLDENGQVKYSKGQTWISSTTGEAIKFNTFSTLIIIEDAP